mgnify:CR=1 FL=1
MGASITIEYIKKEIPAKLGNLATIGSAVGLALAILAFYLEPQRATFGSLIGFMFIMSIGMGALFFIALDHLTTAVWSVPFRRIAEMLTNVFWIAPIFAAPILINIIMSMNGGHGLFDMYHWTHDHEVAIDPFLSQKAPYLNESSFLFRYVLIWVLMMAFKFVLVGNSYKQDKTFNIKLNKVNAKFSALFMVVFAISITVTAIDFMMSLEPHWFSTIYGVYYFAGTFNVIVALITLLAVYLNEKGLMIEGINKDHYYSLGGWMFAFTTFWMYIAFSQFMLIYYANIPEETFWFIPRMEGAWAFWSIALLFIKFIIPFGLSINKSSKVNPKRLKLLAYWNIGAHFFDIWWLTYPTYSHLKETHSPFLGWQELAFVLLSFSLILLIFKMSAKNRSIVPIGDAKMERALNFHL